MRRCVDGILLLDKPVQMTSNAALQRVKRLFNAKKAGHTGSLDPIATGMLPICFGEATKFSQFLLDSNKSYFVVAKLGEQTNTGDTEGEVIQTKSTTHLNQIDVEQVMQTFVGEITQIPPMFSAIKHQGKPLYELARQGMQVDRKPRQVKIFSITLHQFSESSFAFDVHCSKGTYVRTLVEDIAQALNTCAHVIELRRLTVHPYGNAKMYSLSQLEEVAQSGFTGLSDCLLSVETSVQIFPAIKLTSSAAFYLRMGQPVRASFKIDSSLVRLVTEDEKFLGIGEVLPDGRIKPHRLLAQQNLQAAI